MTIVALMDIAESLEASHFDSSWWFGPFGIDIDRIVAEVLPGQLAQAIEAEACAALPGAIGFPMPSNEPRGSIRVLPNQRGGLAILVAEHDGRQALTAMWPFTAEGAEQTIGVERVLMGPDRLQGIIEGTLAGGLKLAWLDPLFAVQRAFYAKGSRQRVALTGIAHIFKIGAAEPVRITPDNPDYQTVLAANPSAVGPDGVIAIQTAGMAAIFPLSQAPQSMYSIQGPVKAVSYFEGTLFGRMAYKIDVLVARVGGADPTEIVLSVLLTDLVLRGGRLPTVGEDISAAVRLQGTLLGLVS